MRLVLVRAAARHLPIALASVCALAVASPAASQSRVYVSAIVDDTGCSSMGSRCTRGLISVVNTDTNLVEASVDLWRRSSTGQGVVELLVHPAGHRLYVFTVFPSGISWSTSVTVFDTSTLAPVTSFALDASVNACAWSLNADRLFCARHFASDVAVIETTAHTVAATIPATYPESVVVSPDGRRLYIAHYDKRVTAHDADTYTLQATIPLAAVGWPLNITPDGSHVYVPSGCSSVVDIDTRTNTVAGVIPDVARGSECVYDIAFARGRAYVTTTGGMGFWSGVTVIDVATRAIQSTIAMNDIPGEILASADESRVYVARDWGFRVIDTATHETTTSPVIHGGPGQLALAPPLPPPILEIDAPASGATVQQPFALAGWAAHVVGTLEGPGIDTVHVWAYPGDGSPAVFAGAAEYGVSRPDVAALFGSGYLNSGYQLLVSGLSPGAYTLVAYGHSSRTRAFAVARAVSLTIAPSLQMAIDAPAQATTVSSEFLVAGWALDGAATTGAGIDAVHVWAYPLTGGDPIFAGAAATGQPRPDVAAIFGTQFANAGYALTVRNLVAGSYTLVVFARQASTSAFAVQRRVNVTIAAPQPIIFIDVPTPNASITSSVRVAGWALEFGATTGTGVDAVHIWAYPASGAAPLFLGAAAYGGWRPDVGDLFGSRYAPSGFDLVGDLPPGAYTIVAFGHSTASNAFNGVRVVGVTVQ